MEHSDSSVTASWDEKELAFAEDQGQGQLSVQKNRGDDIRAKITHHKSLLGTRIYGAVNKVHWGSYDSQPACLLVVRFRFLAPAGLFRLRQAVITICFNKLKTKQSSDSTEMDPVIAVYSPKHIYGISTLEQKETRWDVALQCSASVGPLSFGPEVSTGQTSKFTLDHSLEIAGMDEPEYDKDYPNKVIFEINENDKSGQGIPREMFFGVIVQCTTGLSAEVTTSVGDSTAWPWTKDEPLLLPFGKEFGSTSETLSSQFEEWTDEQWSTLVPYFPEKQSAFVGRAC